MSERIDAWRVEDVVNGLYADADKAYDEYKHSVDPKIQGNLYQAGYSHGLEFAASVMRGLLFDVGADVVRTQREGEVRAEGDRFVVPAPSHRSPTISQPTQREGGDNATR